MAADEIKCPKWKGKMEKGKILSPKSSKWVKGKPLTTLSVLKGEIIWTYRCSSCGYLESYA
ncbi:hypothetical protein HN789_02715 [archaeon]|jgi:hypothetical protein|nr:hypothetical protein [archaeon]MBT4021971.1 hypothetical protein [archaeon]MBT4272287.1 hypothetical protein [archaeon]MBT4460823.1 hypothetical protein [archaeon]MBT4858390.1 hypothetical protein [archaeon]